MYFDIYIGIARLFRPVYDKCENNSYGLATDKIIINIDSKINSALMSSNISTQRE